MGNRVDLGQLRQRLARLGVHLELDERDAASDGSPRLGGAAAGGAPLGPPGDGFADATARRRAADPGRASFNRNHREVKDLLERCNRVEAALAAPARAAPGARPRARHGDGSDGGASDGGASDGGGGGGGGSGGGAFPRDCGWSDGGDLDIAAAASGRAGAAVAGRRAAVPLFGRQQRAGAVPASAAAPWLQGSRKAQPTQPALRAPGGAARRAAPAGARASSGGPVGAGGARGAAALVAAEAGTSVALAALAGGSSSVRGTPLGTLLAQWKEAQAAWAAEKAKLRRDAAESSKRAARLELELKRQETLAAHRAADVASLRAALKGRDVALDDALCRAKAAEDALARASEAAAEKLCALAAERDDLQGLLLATLDRLEAVEGAAAVADRGADVLQEQVHRLEEDRLAALQAAAGAQAGVRELEDARRRLEWQGQLLDKMSEVQLRHSKRKAAAIKDLLADARRAESTGGDGGGGDFDRGSGSGGGSASRALLRALGMASAGQRGGGGGVGGSEGSDGDGEADSLLGTLARAAAGGG